MGPRGCNPLIPRIPIRTHKEPRMGALPGSRAIRKPTVRRAMGTPTLHSSSRETKSSQRGDPWMNVVGSDHTGVVGGAIGKYVVHVPLGPCLEPAHRLMQ